MPKKLVQAFGEQVFDIIETAPERLTELDGFGPVRQQRVVEAWSEQIQTVNNDDRDVYNGDIGHVMQVDADAGVVTVDVEGHSVTYELGELNEVMSGFGLTLSLAYTATVHKSQDSAYPAVVIPLAT